MSAVEAEPTTGRKRTAEGEAVETKAEKKSRRQASAQLLGVHVIGLSHHNAGVDIREKLAVPEDQWNEASAEVSRSFVCFACCVLLVCGTLARSMSYPVSACSF